MLDVQNIVQSNKIKMRCTSYDIVRLVELKQGICLLIE